MIEKKNAFDLARCARSNILALRPYRCARDDYKDDGTNILLDANENAFGPALPLESNISLNDAAGTTGNGSNGSSNGLPKQDINLLSLNRYPDPHQSDLKQRLCLLRNTHTHTSKIITPANLFVGVGSDEAIDAILRCFCRPGHDKILTCPPTYGMYSVSAQVNDLAVVLVPLDSESFSLRPDVICTALSTDPSIKVVYICSPGNPTGGLISKDAIRQVLEHKTWNGVVVVDEAYIDFAPDGSSLAEWVAEWPNLVVMQTLSKAFGLAGIRLGAAFAAPEVAVLLNNLKAPYNVSSLTSTLAFRALSTEGLALMRKHRARILEQRDRLVKELVSIPGVGRLRGGREANFLLVEMLNGRKEAEGKPSNVVALRIYEQLAEQEGVVVRFRGKEYGCEACLRITVGTKEEVDRFLMALKDILREVMAQKAGHDEERAEQKANSIIA